jgi:pimeloyl-ACP methyl ester carboxylesterase
MPINIESVKTDDFTMDFFRFGRGERPLVILPGLSIQSVMDAADAIAAAYEPLADAFRIYVFDRRKELSPVYTVQDMARDTAQAFKALGLEKVCLFGASQGGMIALVLAIEYHELVGKMVLGSTSAHVKAHHYEVIEKWIDIAKKGDGKELYLSFGSVIYPPEVFEQYRDTLIAAAATVTKADLKKFIILAEGTKNFNVADKLSAIRCPVLAVGEYYDSVLDPDATMEIAEKLDHRDDFRLFMYIGFGHAAFDTAPDYRERLLRFFTE